VYQCHICKTDSCKKHESECEYCTRITCNECKKKHRTCPLHYLSIKKQQSNQKNQFDGRTKQHILSTIKSLFLKKKKKKKKFTTIESCWKKRLFKN
jgi:hypothetical protein